MKRVRRGTRVSVRGFTLVETMIALALLVPVVITATSVAVFAARESRWATEIAEAEAAIEAAATVLEAELAPLQPGDGVLGLSPATLRYRARRAAGRWCQADSLGVIVSLAGPWAASRLPVAARDSTLIRVPDSTAASGIRMLRLGLSAPPVADTCPSGAAGLRLVMAGAPPGNSIARLIETEEVVELAAYGSGGQLWLGLVHLGTTAPIEPVAGPFGGAGVVFTGLDNTGVATLDPARVHAVKVELHATVPAVGSRILVIRFRG